MPSKGLISSADSLGILECQGSVALASLLQQIAASTRARIIGSTSFNAAGIATVVIAGGLAEVQHAVETLKSAQGVANSAFFAKPDLAAMKLLLASLNIAAAEVKEQGERRSPRVREVSELDIAEMELWNVHELRRYARSIPNAPIHGRAISRANRDELLNILRPLATGSSNPLAYPAGDHRPN
jgi:hypothetical protein